LPAENGNPENIATAVTEVSERVTLLIREEIELAKAEVTQKVSSLAKGLVAMAAAAVCGVFAIIFVPLTLAWVFDAIFVSGGQDIWIGFAIVLLLLVVATAALALIAWRKMKVGAPTPKMAIEEAKKIRATVTTKSGAGS
jgi:uncharacterized small protein (DUF1192 family)